MLQSGFNKNDFKSRRNLVVQKLPVDRLRLLSTIMKQETKSLQLKEITNE